jgi:D-xylose transport system substrate-binding protein
MKRIVAWCALAVSLVLICGAVPARPSRPLVGLSLPTQREERWVRDKQAMEAEARRLGLDLRVQVTDNDAARQVAQCENLISQGVRVLILAPHDASSASVIVDRAARAGIPVISYDRLVTDSPRDYYYVSFDNVKVGELQGEYLVGRVKQGNLVVLAGSPTDNNARLFRAGAMKVIGPLVRPGGLRIVMDQAVKDWQPAEAQRLMEQALTATGNHVDGVLAPNDGTAGGVIQALAAQHLAGRVPVTGQDAELAAAIRIVQGTQSMTVFKDTRLLARKAIGMALALAQGRRLETGGVSVSNNKHAIPAVLLAPVVVTRENLDRVLIASGYLKREQVHRARP